MGSADPFLSALKNFGLCVVRLPRANIGPLTVLVRDGSKLIVTGTLPELFKSALKAPSITRDQSAAGISADRTRDLDVNLGVSLLEGWLEAMGGTTIGLDTSFKSFASVSFSFPGLTVDSLSGIELDKYLATAELDTTAKHHAKLLDNDKIYVIALAAKSSRILVEAKAGSGTGAELKAPAIQQIVGAKVVVSVNSNGTNALTYEGKDALYFGFQALQLFFKNGRYQSFEPVSAGKVAILSDDGTEQAKRRSWLQWNAPFTAVEVGQ